MEGLEKGCRGSGAVLKIVQDEELAEVPVKLRDFEVLAEVAHSRLPCVVGRQVRLSSKVVHWIQEALLC